MQVGRSHEMIASKSIVNSVRLSPPQSRAASRQITEPNRSAVHSFELARIETCQGTRVEMIQLPLIGLCVLLIWLYVLLVKHLRQSRERELHLLREHYNIK